MERFFPTLLTLFRIGNTKQKYKFEEENYFKYVSIFVIKNENLKKVNIFQVVFLFLG